MGHFATIEDIKRANAAAGKFYFSPDTMRFFNSRVDTYVYGGRYFVTSERQDDASPRLYSVREAHEDGDVYTVGGFQGYRTLQGARNAAKRLAQAALDAELQAELIAEAAAHRRAERYADEQYPA